MNCPDDIRNALGNDVGDDWIQRVVERIGDVPQASLEAMRMRAENDALKLRIKVLEKTVSELGGRISKMLTAGVEHRERLVAISMGDPP